LSTAGGLVFFGNENNDFSAVNATTGVLLWSYPTGNYWHASPMTYSVNGKQYVAVASPTKVLVFSLPGGAI
jgi:alcohol dehydrogenase (cytochrome c)